MGLERAEKMSGRECECLWVDECVFVCGGGWVGRCLWVDEYSVYRYVCSLVWSGVWRSEDKPEWLSSLGTICLKYSLC